jgi:hypothetical protein
MTLRSSFGFFHQGVSLCFSLCKFPGTIKLLLDDTCSRTIAIIRSLRLK